MPGAAGSDSAGRGGPCARGCLSARVRAPGSAGQAASIADPPDCAFPSPSGHCRRAPRSARRWDVSARVLSGDLPDPASEQTVPPSAALKPSFPRPGTPQGHDDRAAVVARPHGETPMSPGSLVALGARGRASGLRSGVHRSGERGKPGRGGSPARSCLAGRHCPAPCGQRTGRRL